MNAKYALRTIPNNITLEFPIQNIGNSILINLYIKSTKEVSNSHPSTLI